MVLLPLWLVAAALLGARAAAGRQVSERESERPARRLRRSPSFLPSLPFSLPPAGSPGLGREGGGAAKFARWV